MEKVNISFEPEHVHLNLGISDERAQELDQEIKETVIRKALENNIIQIDEKEMRVQLSGAAVIDQLVNKIAKTHAEQLFLMLFVKSLVTALHERIQAGGAEPEDEEEL